MKTVWIGGNHPRHLYYANRIHAAFPLAGAVVEARENMLPAPPEGIAEHDRQNFIRHFQNRDLAEQRHFGVDGGGLPGCPVHQVAEDTLNTEESARFVRSLDPDAVLIFGCGLVRDPLLSALPGNTLNLHLGLSPRYRGSAGLFWPFYFMEPNQAGTTFHYITAEPDAGDVVHQVVPGLEAGDGIHDVACKAVLESADQALQLLEAIEAGGRWERFRQRGTGKLFLTNDFKPEHLRVIYDVFDDDMVRQYLDGRLACKEPRLVRQF